MRNKMIKAGMFLGCLLFQAATVYAEARSKEEIQLFLESMGSFLIQIIGPGILVIGVAIAGISMAMGSERGIQRGVLAAVGGAIIMLSRAILDLIMNLTGF